MTTIRVARRKRFTTVERDTVNDGRLSFRARGVLVWLLDKPDDWKANADTIAKAGREGRDAIRAVLNELRDAGYLEYQTWQEAGTGQWLSEWIVHERPIPPETGNQASENQRWKSGVGKPGRVVSTETDDCPSEQAVSRFDSHPVPPREEAAPAPWLDEGITAHDWMLKQREDAK